MDLAQRKSEPEKKEKKTRRRLRLSCVECTKRRQKCDRNYPCSLCVSRGVQHLCRWETVPVARPPPARPPEVIRSTGTHDQTIRELTARIATLEQALANSNQNALQLPTSPIESRPSIHTQQHHTPPYQQYQQHQDDNSTIIPYGTPVSNYASPPPASMNGAAMSIHQSPAATSSPESCPGMTPPSFSPEPLGQTHGTHDAMVAIKPLTQTMYDTTSTLAQLSIAHHGEYIGRGSLICALHSISAGKTPRFLYAKSTDSTSISREPKAPFSAYPMSSGMEDLIRNIPSMVVSNALIQSFFAQVNWRFGVPDQWFLSACTQMWKVLQYPEGRGFQINANWLSLFFAVLASTPPDTLHFYHQQINQFRPGDASRTIECIADEFFACSMAARRLAEEEHLKQPSLSLMNSAADGTVLGCLAVPLLCCYLAERGRVSEAWKLAGNAIRNAEAVGMHRDPAWRQWQIMSEDERLLRRRAWWGLVIWDMLYSFLLGRPKMIRKEIFDVALPSLDDPDVNQNPFNLYQAVLIQLSGIVGEALEKCFSVEYPNCPVFFEVDQKFHQWGQQLPPQFQCERDDNGSLHLSNNYEAGYLSTLARHRYTLHTWYLLMRMKLHIASITGQGRTPQRRSHIEESRRLCIVFAMDLIRLQCETWENALQHKAGSRYDLPGSHWFFEGCFALFEAAVALVTTLCRYPWPEKAGEAEQLIDRAVVVLTQVVREEQGKKGEIARMAVEVLTSLANEHWWRARSPTSSPEGDASLLLHPAMYNHHGQLLDGPTATQLSGTVAPPPPSTQPVTLIGDHGQLYHQWYGPSSYEASMMGHHPHTSDVATSTEDVVYDVDSANGGNKGII